MADTYVSVWDYPEFFDPKTGQLLDKYAYLADWRLSNDERRKLMNAALDPLFAAELKYYNDNWAKDIADYAASLKTVDPVEQERQVYLQQQAAAAAAQQKSIDAYNAAEKKRLEALYKKQSPALLSWFERANAEVAAAGTTTPAPPPAAVDVEAERLRELQMQYQQRLAASLKANQLKLKDDQAAAEAMLQAPATARTSSVPGLDTADAGGQQTGFFAALERALEDVLSHTNLRGIK